jgi:hypothetical protein
MQLFTDPRLALILTTAIYAYGAIRYLFLSDWPNVGYHACAAGLQLAVLSMGGK